MAYFLRGNDITSLNIIIMLTSVIYYYIDADLDI